MPGKRGNHGGHIRQRADGRWEAKYTAADGKVKSLYRKTQAEAQLALNKAQHERDMGLPGVKDERQTVAAYMASWLETIKPQVRESAWISYEHRIRLYITLRLGRVKLAQLSPQHVRELHAWMLNEKKLSPTTVNHTHGVLGHALKDAQRMGLVARNVAELVDPPRKNKRRSVIYTPDQLAKLLEALRGQPIEPIATLSATTGARLGELLAVTWANVDLDRASITIHSGRAQVEDGWADTEPKTDAANRTISLTAHAVALLREHRKAQIERRLWLGDAWEDNDYVFPNEVGGSQFHSVIDHRFKKLVTQAGLPPIRVHDLRHTVGSLLLAQGVHVPEVARILGHASPDITYRLYAHAIPQAQQQALDAMERILHG